jgi:hypothetical protein
MITLGVVAAWMPGASTFFMKLFGGRHWPFRDDN